MGGGEAEATASAFDATDLEVLVGLSNFHFMVSGATEL